MSVLGLLAVIGCIGWKVGSQWRGSAVNLKKMAQLPAASAAITGWRIFHGHSLQAITGTNWRFLALQAPVAIVLGAARGPSVALSEKNGYLTLRYRAMSVVLWIVLGAIGVALAWRAGADGARLVTGTSAVMLLLSLSELAELAVVAARAMASPIPSAMATKGSGESTAVDGRSAWHARRTRRDLTVGGAPGGRHREAERRDPPNATDDLGEPAVSARGLAGVAETALITLYNRGSEARLPDRLLGDPLAAHLVTSLDYPFSERFGTPDQSHVLRARQFDQQVGCFLAEHPHGTVVALGEGLETQLWRVDNGTLRWVSVDLPEIIALRRRLLPVHPRNQLIACSALDPSWTASIEPADGVLILAQGLLMYLTPADIDSFFEMVAQRSPGATIVFDTIPAWAATRTGHRQSAAYRMPPQPWGTGPHGVRQIRRRHPAITELRFLPAPRGRGLAWGVAYPAATRLPLTRGLLPMTVAASTSSLRPAEWDQHPAADKVPIPAPNNRALRGTHDHTSRYRTRQPTLFLSPDPGSAGTQSRSPWRRVPCWPPGSPLPQQASDGSRGSARTRRSSRPCSGPPCWPASDWASAS